MLWMTEWKRMLDENRPFIVQHLATSNSLLDEAISIGFITSSEEEYIKAEKNANDRSRYFLEVSARKTHSQIQQLIEILMKCGQSSMADCFREILGKCICQICSQM